MIREPISVDPIHAILSSFPVALFVAAFVADITYFETAQMQWSNFASWLLAGGLLFGGIALLDGIVGAWLGRSSARRRRSLIHIVVSLALWLLGLIDALIHTHDGWTSVVPAGLALSGVVAVLALVAAWFGFSLFVRERR